MMQAPVFKKESGFDRVLGFAGKCVALALILSAGLVVVSALLWVAAQILERR